MTEQPYTTVDVGATREARAAMDEMLWWKPKAGEGNRWKDNPIRILPPHRAMEGKLYWGIPLHFGVGPGNAVIPCPRKAFNQRCPICDEGFKLLNEGKREDGLDNLPTWAGYMNVVPLNEDGTPEGDNPKVRVWSASRGIIDDIIDILETLGDFTDPAKGHDINVRRRGTSKKNTKYQTAAATEPTAFDYPELLSEIHNLVQLSPYWEVPKMIEAMSATDDPLAAAAEEQTANQQVAHEQPRALSGGRFGTPPDDDEEAGEPQPEQSDDERAAAQQRLKDQITQPAAKTTKTSKPKKG